MKVFRRRGSGFTLIELIVVVAIISILAIIALPNFSDATTRAKVAAVKNNMRVVATKFEMLNVDTNRYPLAGKWRWGMVYSAPTWQGGGTNYADLFTQAYKTMYGPFDDVFEIEALKRNGLLDAKWLPNDGRSHLCHGFNFFHPLTMINAINSGLDWDGAEEANWTTLREIAGDWVMVSPGPDLVAESPAWISSSDEGNCETGQTNYNEKMLFHEYDPTNGTISYGNIFRSQKNPAGLGTHPHFYE